MLRPADGGDGGDVGVAPGRIDKHAGGADFAVTGRAVRNIDVAAGIQRDAFRAGQVGGQGGAEGGAGRLIERGRCWFPPGKNRPSGGGP